uniref:ANK_REP_REGION domain-containing protein n=1 Tax=Rhabditophanes sp. KR3021 TaxID=114890 RepID=A0AC35U0P6_9BILA
MICYLLELKYLKKEYPSAEIAINIKCILVDALDEQIINPKSGETPFDIVSLMHHPDTNKEVADLILKDFYDLHNSNEYSEYDLN